MIPLLERAKCRFLLYACLVCLCAISVRGGPARHMLVCDTAGLNCTETTNITCLIDPNGTASTWWCTCPDGPHVIAVSCMEMDPCDEAAARNCSVSDPADLCVNATEDVLDCQRGTAHLSSGDDGRSRCAIVTDGNKLLGCKSEGSECRIEAGGIRCVCKTGYTGSGHHCVDIDECTAGDHNCARQGGACTNTASGFQCSCLGGYHGDGLVCSDVTECSLGLHNCTTIGGQCAETDGGFACSCQNGFTGNGYQCKDLDECAMDNHGCSKNAECRNSMGVFSCHCFQHFAGNGFSCSPDECAMGTHRCYGDNVVCRDRAMGYDCVCPAGFGLEESLFGCRDVDECLRQDACKPGFLCLNLEGSFACLCGHGYEPARLNGQAVCDDINECQRVSHHTCDVIKEKCRNLNGSFECVCNVGFTASGESGECQDVNECWLHPSACPPTSSCLNTEGSFECPCKNGSVFLGGVCRTLPDCASNSCGESAFCKVFENTPTCLCRLGFESFSDTCYNVDECSHRLHNCIDVPDSHCVDVEGSFMCPCNRGYEAADNGLCLDFDECGGRHPCDGNATCNNNAGSYQCYCNIGYSGSGFEGDCDNINECLSGVASVCSRHNTRCADSPGSYRCDCLVGFYHSSDGECRTDSELYETLNTPQARTSTTLTWTVRKFPQENLLNYKVIVIHLGLEELFDTSPSVFHIAPNIVYAPGGPNTYSYTDAMATRPFGSTPRAYVAAEFNITAFGDGSAMSWMVGGSRYQGDGPLLPGHAYALFYLATELDNTEVEGKFTVTATSPYQRVQVTKQLDSQETDMSRVIIVASSLGGSMLLAIVCTTIVARFIGRGRKPGGPAKRSGTGTGLAGVTWKLKLRANTSSSMSSSSPDKVPDCVV